MKTQKQNNMKQLITILFLLCPMLLLGQVKHELKTDVGAILDNFIYETTKFTFQLSYEAVLKRKIGIEFGFRYNDNQEQVTVENINQPYMSWFFDKRYIQFYLEGKYYFFPKNVGDKLWGGLYTRHRFETYKDPAFFQKVEEFNLPQYRYIKKPYEELELGLSLGYKWLIKDRIIIEPSYGMSLDFSSFVHKEYEGKGALDIEAKILLNIGYRF